MCLFHTCNKLFCPDLSILNMIYFFFDRAHQYLLDNEYFDFIILTIIFLEDKGALEVKCFEEML